jgi:hypothetical protein
MKNNKILAALAATGIAVYAIKKIANKNGSKAAQTGHNITSAFAKAKEYTSNPLEQNLA